MDLSLLKTLRDQTGAGMGECKAALEEAGNDLAKAVEVLRIKGALKAAKKSERTAAEGVIASYLHPNAKVASLLLLACETDFVARNEGFIALARDLAMQVASESPLYLSPEDVPMEVLEKEREIYREQLATEGKPPEIREKIISGKLSKYYSDVCLLEQVFIKDDTKKVQDLISEAVLKLGENIRVVRFVRFQI